MAGDARGVVAHAIDEAGNATALQEQQLADAQAAGFRPISATEASQRAQADQDSNYVDEHYGTLGKAGLGVLDGATLGLAPAGLVASGLMDAGHLDAARQAGAYVAGDVAGMVLPTILSGGGAAEARGAGAAFRAALGATPAGIMGRVGGTAERLVAGFLPEAGLLGKTASGAIKMAARGASEAALMSMAHQASDDIIHNKPLTAQAILASGADGALFGGLTGGLLGGATSLASAGVEEVGGKVLASAAGKGGERSAAVALDQLGMAGKFGEIAKTEGRFTGALKDYVDVIQKADTSISAGPSAIKANVSKLVAEQEVVASNALKELSQVGAPPPSLIQNLKRRLSTEYEVMYKGTANQESAGRLYDNVYRRLKPAASWENWAKNREILADELRAAKEGSVKQGVFKSVLNAFDDEFQTAGRKVDETLFNAYSQATTQRRIGEELVQGQDAKLASDAARGNPLHLNGADAATGAYGLIAGHPVGAAGIVLGKKITGYIQEKMQPTIAEYAARASLGSAAGAATANVGQRISGALRNFMTGARVSTEKAHVQTTAPKLSYTMKSFQQKMDLAEQLTSLAHQQKVREHTDALRMAGHEELATEMANTYGRAVAYIQQNMPKGKSKEASMGNLGKPSKTLAPDTQGMKFLRQLQASLDPVGTIVEGLERGNLSRDAVATIKYVMPDLHQDIVTRAAQEVMAMKSEGKYLPADKEALLGVVLDYPVSTKLTPEFIREVQQGLAANSKPQPKGNDGPPPVTDVSSYQTPLQSAV